MKIIGIIPAYNPDDRIFRAVDSFVRNGVDKVIVINDGSDNDESIEILEILKNMNKKVEVISSVNRGLSNARNLGIEKALEIGSKELDYKYATFLDADDYFAQNSVQKLSAKLEEGNERTYAYPVVKEFNHGEQDTTYLEFDYFSHLFRNRLPYSILLPLNILKSGIRYRNSKSLLYWTEDYDFSLQLIEKGFIPLKTEEAVLNYDVNTYSMKDYVLDNFSKVREELIERNPIFTDFNKIEKWRKKYNGEILKDFDFSKKIKCYYKFSIGMTKAYIYKLFSDLKSYGNYHLPQPKMMKKKVINIIEIEKKAIYKILFHYTNNDDGLISHIPFDSQFWNNFIVKNTSTIKKEKKISRIMRKFSHLGAIPSNRPIKYIQFERSYFDVVLHHLPPVIFLILKNYETRLKLIIMCFLVLHKSRIIIDTKTLKELLNVFPSESLLESHVINQRESVFYEIILSDQGNN